MNIYTTSSLIAFVLLGMGVSALILGTYNHRENKKSKSGKEMFWVCVCVFVWDMGYAWMSLCFHDDFAYVPRALALLAVTFYMVFILRYVAVVTDYPRKKINLFLAVITVISLLAWTQIIPKNAVEFVSTPWGYWYYSKMTVARLVQFATVLAAMVEYYVILSYGKKNAVLKRKLFVLNRFRWFGPILFVGYMFDTLVPTLFHIPAIPGSAISAFASSMILFWISQNNKVFGLSKVNVSKYVFEDVQLPVIIADNSGKIVLYNDITSKYLMREENELLGHYLDDFFQPEDDELVIAVHSGHECKVDITQVKDQFDALLYSIYIFRDVSKQQQAFRMLQESQAMAEEANRAKSNFLANMSHEIRTPMNAIIGMSEIILQDSGVPEKTRLQVSEIHTAGQNLLGIVNDILDISKIEAGKYELVAEEYELPSLIHDVSNIIRVRLQESNAVFVLKLDETLPKALVGDVGRIRQILLNILGNAVKFIEKGSITLTAGWNHDENQPMLRFDVADTGIGIKPENLVTIFGEFNQVDTRKNRNIQGTGLGLAISKHLAELMGGDITVESVYGEGSTFHIYLRQELKDYHPLGAELTRELERQEYRMAVSKKTLEVTKRPDARVLIVDDTRVNLMVARGIMKKYDMQIDTASGGKEAIEMVQKKDYDIIFMDHMMPEMDGVEATKQIRALGQAYEKLTIIALTANAINDAKEMFLQEGMQDFVAKPIDPKALDEVLNRWLPVK